MFILATAAGIGYLVNGVHGAVVGLVISGVLVFLIAIFGSDD